MAAELDMIKEDLVADRIAIDSYREMIEYIGDKDSTTRRMLEGTLAMEEEHADDLVGMPEDLKKKGGPMAHPTELGSGWRPSAAAGA